MFYLELCVFKFRREGRKERKFVIFEGGRVMFVKGGRFGIYKEEFKNFSNLGKFFVEGGVYDNVKYIEER